MSSSKKLNSTRSGYIKKVIRKSGKRNRKASGLRKR